ncbi:MAG: cytochrome c-type biogenesis protein [Burkholderiaceae bacterium]
MRQHGLPLILAFLCSMGFAQTDPKEAAPLAQDPIVEKRLNEISEEMRCLVCQNESLAGSRSELALDLRREIRTLIKEGKSNQEIRDFMVSRYGDFVLYRPPVKSTTLLLWIGPFVLMVGGFFALMVALKRRRKNRPTTTLSVADIQKAETLLRGEKQ